MSQSGFLNGTDIKNVVLDFHKTDYYGVTALGFFVKLWKKVMQKKSSRPDARAWSDRDAIRYRNGPVRRHGCEELTHATGT
jgi:hypothetical protein